MQQQTPIPLPQVLVLVPPLPAHSVAVQHSPSVPSLLVQASLGKLMMEIRENWRLALSWMFGNWFTACTAIGCFLNIQMKHLFQLRSRAQGLFKRDIVRIQGSQERQGLQLPEDFRGLNKFSGGWFWSPNEYSVCPWSFCFIPRVSIQGSRMGRV